MRKRGFTLLEVLLTVLLAVTGFVALLQSAGMAISASGTGESELVAVNLAQEKMDDLRTLAYSSIAGETRTAVPGFGAFEREVVVTTPVTNLKEITVNVYWVYKSAEMNTSLVTYVSNI